MNIIKDFIPVNPYSRPGKKLDDIKAVVIHWVEKPMATAASTKKWFADAPVRRGYGSTQYVVGLKGEVIQMMEENEVSYNCGTSKLDPVSGKIYTDLARSMFGEKYTNPTGILTPNNLTIGIENCHPDTTGKFLEATLNSLVELVVDIFKRNPDKLTDPMTQILTHNQIVGWKDCPRWFVNNPLDFIAFKEKVALILKPSVKMNDVTETSINEEVKKNN